MRPEDEKETRHPIEAKGCCNLNVIEQHLCCHRCLLNSSCTYYYPRFLSTCASLFINMCLAFYAYSLLGLYRVIVHENRDMCTTRSHWKKYIKTIWFIDGFLFLKPELLANHHMVFMKSDGFSLKAITRTSHFQHWFWYGFDQFFQCLFHNLCMQSNASLGIPT